MTETESPPSLSLVSHIDALPTGTRLAEFEVVELLGVGGFGMVYKAFDHSLQRLVAIKEYMPSALAGRSRGMTVSMKSSADALTFMAGLKSFVAEARLLAQFDHPSLVKVFRFWEANNTAYMVMPLYSGMTFKQARHHMRCPPSEAWLRKVLWSVLGALNVLHEGNTMHRDVSPDNIFLQDVGPPVLLDLGAARRAISDKSQKHTAILKVNYAPIEQYADAEDMRQGPWTDLYSLAAVVHGYLCNEPPVPATFRVLKDRLPSFASVAATVQEQFGEGYSASFIDAITHALAIRPEDRPQSTEGFGQEMALATPSSMSRFDWRAELGDIYLPSGVQPEEARALLTTTPVSDLPTQLYAGAPGSATGRQGSGLFPEVELPEDEHFSPTTTAPMVNVMHGRPPGTEPSYESVAARPSPATQPAPLLPPERPAARRRLGFAMAAGVVLLAGAGLLAWLGMAPQVETSAVAVPAPAASTAVPVAQPAVNPIPSEPKATVLPVAVSATVPAVQASAASTKPASAPLAAASAPAKRVLPAPAPLAGTPTPALPKPTTDAKAPVVADVPASAPARPLASRPPTRPDGPEATAAGRPGGAELCADSGFLARPMCIFRECQKPELAGLAVCVEQKKRFQNANNPQAQ
ncbi:MAG TPA: protein kinase [Burkholderiaceae bacterium]|nr:protein kinase [Burkholderiaceae bacterium]